MTESTPPSHMSATRSSGRGLVQVFTGDGKGKTSAAIGTVIRALGNGFKVFIVAFMKAEYPSGEWEILSGMERVNVARFGTGHFVDPDNIKAEDRLEAEKALSAVQAAVLSGKYDLVVLDEVNVAAAWKLIDTKAVLRMIEEKPAGVEMVLTGRGADKEIVRMADLVTEMLNIKHPYEQGIAARRGIEY